MRINKIISFVLALTISATCIILPTSTVSAASEKPAVIADLTNKSVIDQTTLVSSSLYTKTGTFTAKWGDSNIHNEVVIPVSNTSMLDIGYIEFWAYSANSTDMEFAFVLDADNPETIDTDYYYTTIKTNWVGWKRFSVSIKNIEVKLETNSAADESGEKMSWEEYDNYLAEQAKKDNKNTPKFIEAGSPLNITEIKSIKLWPTFAGLTPVDGTNIYFDKIEYVKEQSADAYIDGSDSSNNPRYVLVDFTNPELSAQEGYEFSTEHSVDGLGAAKIAGENLINASSYKPSLSDWSQYNRVNIEMYSEKATGSDFTFQVGQENSDTSGSDFYSDRVYLDWEGKWNIISWTFDAETNTTSLIKSRTPLGFSKVSKLSLSFTYSNRIMSDDTVFYIKRIYLDREEPYVPPVIDNNEDYIPEHVERYITKPIEQNMRATIERKEHPRILCTKEEFEENMRLYKEGDVYLTNAVNNVLKSADQWLTVGDSKYELYDGKRLVRNERFIIKECAFAYAVTGEQKYFDRMYRAIEVTAAWPDWNPTHWLDVAEYAYAYTIAYDLCYDSFTEAQRRVLRNGLMKNGIHQGNRTWRANGSVPRVESNWQEVCAGGVGMAALVLVDEPGYLDICSEFICHAIRTLPKGLAAFAPDGAFPEGMAYWGYACQYFFNFASGLFNTLGTDYGLTKMEGLDKTGFFPIVSVGPTLSFNYGDTSGSKSGTSDPCMYFMSEIYNDPSFATFRYQTALNSGSFEDFLSYRKDIVGDDYKKLIPLDIMYRGEQEIAYTRSSLDSNGTWLAYKGGNNSGTHGDLDKGSFVLDMQNVRWIQDPGAGSYNTTDYFQRKAGEGRWRVYKKRAEGHNTLVINPSTKTNEDQIIDAFAHITEFKTSDSGSYGIVDLTPCYRDDVTKATRGFALTENRNTVIVQDEIKTDKPIEVYSFFSTLQNIKLTDDPKVAYMYTDDGKKVRFDITSPANASWAVMDNIPLATSPVNEENFTISSNVVSGQKLFVHLKNASNPTISVTIRNVFSGVEETSPAPVKPISEWDSYLEEAPTVDMLYIDGIPVNGFSKYNSTYALNGSYGPISADYDADKFYVEYVDGKGMGDTSYCKVTDKKTGAVSYYYVSFAEVFIDINPEALEKITIVDAVASDIPEPLNVPANTYDGNMTNRWAAENEAWIVWELDGVYKIDQVLLSFWKGDQRSTTFDLYVSTDNTNWTQVFSGKAAGNTSALEVFKLNGVYDAKYVKFYGFGNNENGWNSVQEVYIPKILDDYVDVTGHWAIDDINQMRLLNILSGKTKTIFDPESNMTIAEFITAVIRCLGFEPSEYKSVFSDVTSDKWYADNLQAAYDQGLIPEVFIKGGKINPDKDITREEMSVILSKAYGKLYTSELINVDLTKYGDYSEMNPEYYSYISDSIAARYIKGRGTKLYAPKATATRAEAAVILKRLYLSRLTSPTNLEVAIAE